MWPYKVNNYVKLETKLNFIILCAKLRNRANSKYLTMTMIMGCGHSGGEKGVGTQEGNRINTRILRCGHSGGE